MALRRLDVRPSRDLMGSLCEKVQVDTAKVRRKWGWGGGTGCWAVCTGRVSASPTLHSELPSFWKDDSSGQK